MEITDQSLRKLRFKAWKSSGFCRDLNDAEDLVHDGILDYLQAQKRGIEIEKNMEAYMMGCVRFRSYRRVKNVIDKRTFEVSIETRSAGPLYSPDKNSPDYLLTRKYDPCDPTGSLDALAEKLPKRHRDWYFNRFKPNGYLAVDHADDCRLSRVKSLLTEAVSDKWDKVVRPKSSKTPPALVLGDKVTWARSRGRETGTVVSIVPPAGWPDLENELRGYRFSDGIHLLKTQHKKPNKYNSYVILTQESLGPTIYWPDPKKLTKVAGIMRAAA